MSENKTAQQFEDDVLAHFEDAVANEPGKYSAINWGALAAKVKQAVAVVGPIVATLTPPQYQAIVALVIKLVSDVPSPQS